MIEDLNDTSSPRVEACLRVSGTGKSKVKLSLLILGKTCILTSSAKRIVAHLETIPYTDIEKTFLWAFILAHVPPLQTLYLATPGWLAEPQSKWRDGKKVEADGNIVATTNTPPKSFIVLETCLRLPFLGGRSVFRDELLNFGGVHKVYSNNKKNTSPSPKQTNPGGGEELSEDGGLISNWIISRMAIWQSTWMEKNLLVLQDLLPQKKRICPQKIPKN